VHNQVLIDQTVITCLHEEGVEAWDLEDPTTPALVATTTSPTSALTSLSNTIAVAGTRLELMDFYPLVVHN
jgi:hypothetical protein